MTMLWGVFSTLYGLVSLMLGLVINPVSLVGLLALYQWRRTGLEEGPLSPSQQRWRQAALVVLVLMVAGFGLCGGAGTLMGLYSVLTTAQGEAHAYGWMFVVIGGAGLVLAGGLWWLVRRYRREEGWDDTEPADLNNPL